MTYNANVFYVDWQNPQINSATTNWGFFAVQNADKASTQGVELELAGGLGDGFSYGLGYTYTDAQLDSDAIAADGAYHDGHKGDQLPGCRNIASTPMPVTASRSDRLADSPWRYLLSVGNAECLEPEPTLRYHMKGFTMLNLSMTYSCNAWDTTLWIKNIANVERQRRLHRALHGNLARAELLWQRLQGPGHLAAHDGNHRQLSFLIEVTSTSWVWPG